MKKLTFLSLSLFCASAMLAQQLELEDLNGMPYIPGFSAVRMSNDGTQLVGDNSELVGTLYYNLATKTAYFYENTIPGQGYNVADNGWIVGSQYMSSDINSNMPVIMSDGEANIPPSLNGYYTGNIHSITPDASRICGVLGNSGAGVSYFPFYCDIDANGNISEPRFLPFPETDFFGAYPQYCSAKWISADGKTIIGQVIQNRGALYYPIVYRELSDGNWQYTTPSQSLFNGGEDLPEPLGEFEEEYPDVIVPNAEEFIAPDKMAEWQAALANWEANNYAEELDPYANLRYYMTAEGYEEYEVLVSIYNIYFEEYNQKNLDYWEAMFNVADRSVLFGLNMMALSPNGKWMASSGRVTTPPANPDDDPIDNYVPYLFNLQTGEIIKAGTEGLDLVTNQVLDNGTIICATFGGAVPQRSYIYIPATGETLGIMEYLKTLSADAANWIELNLSGEIPVAETADGGLKYEYMTITGRTVTSADLNTIASGVDGYALDYGMEFTYVIQGLDSGVEEILADPKFDGVYRVYNLGGVKVLETKEASTLNELPAGLYIINGKKILINK